MHWSYIRAAPTLRSCYSSVKLPPMTTTKTSLINCVHSTDFVYIGTHDSPGYKAYLWRQYRTTWHIICWSRHLYHQKKAQKAFPHEEFLKPARCPVEVPQCYTSDEIKVLLRFRDTNCAHTPHLMDNIKDRLPSGVKEQSMTAGLAMFTFVRKMPRERIM